MRVCLAHSQKSWPLQWILSQGRNHYFCFLILRQDLGSSYVGVQRSSKTWEEEGRRQGRLVDDYTGVQCKVQFIKVNKEPVSIFVGVEFKKYLGLRDAIGRFSRVFLCFRIWATSSLSDISGIVALRTFDPGKIL